LCRFIFVAGEVVLFLIPLVEKDPVSAGVFRPLSGLIDAGFGAPIKMQKVPVITLLTLLKNPVSAGTMCHAVR